MLSDRVGDRKPRDSRESIMKMTPRKQRRRSRDHILFVRLNSFEDQLVRHAADQQGLNVADFVRLLIRADSGALPGSRRAVATTEA
jgi:hypothetical protein